MSLAGASTTTVVRPRLRRRVGYAVLTLVMFGLLPAAGVVALAVSGGTWKYIAAAAIVVLQAVLLVSVASNIGQQWVVDADTVQMRRPGRGPRTWKRSGLGVELLVSPLYYRGVRAGTKRVLYLNHGGKDDKIDAGVLGRAGATALVAAIRPRPDPHPVPGWRFDERCEVHHDVIRRYRRWRLKWRALGVLTAVSGLALGSAALSDGPALLGSMLLAAGVVIPAYVVASLVLQVVRRPAGAVPAAVRVTRGQIDVERDPTSVDRYVLSDVEQVEISADLVGEGILRIRPRTGGSVSYSLTGRVGEDFRRDVVPGISALRQALHWAGDSHGVPVIELQS